MSRVYRLPIYIEKVKERLADGLTMTDAQGRAVAVVLPGIPMRRRGRPTKEETAARLQGEIVMPTDDSPETRKRREIAKLLGLEVVNGEAKREKNNAELKAEREAREAEKEKQEPSLFGAATGNRNNGTTKSRDNETDINDNNDNGAAPSPCAQLQSDAYELRMAQDKLHLNQLAWMLSPELAKRTETVQSLRVTSESASERAKLLAEQGADAKAIEPYAQQAKEATEAYLAIYADVDEELAILHKRLYLDEPFVERFKARFKGVNIERVQYITRPYYEKIKSPELDLRIKTIIEQENPEYAAKMKAEEEKKQEVSELLRYLKRKDKPNVKQRIETMKKRYTRLVELLGEQEASIYRPIVDAAIEDYEAHYKKPDADATGVVADGGKKKQRGRKAKTAEK
jgi:predicted DNA-binding protein